MLVLFWLEEHGRICVAYMDVIEPKKMNSNEIESNRIEWVKVVAEKGQYNSTSEHPKGN